MIFEKLIHKLPETIHISNKARKVTTFIIVSGSIVYAVGFLIFLIIFFENPNQ